MHASLFLARANENVFDESLVCAIWQNRLQRVYQGPGVIRVRVQLVVAQDWVLGLLTQVESDSLNSLVNLIGMRDPLK